MLHGRGPRKTILVLPAFLWMLSSGAAPVATVDPLPGPGTRVVQEQRVEILIRDSTFLLTQPVTLQRGMSTVIILRNQDIIRHGFTSPVLHGLLVRGEGEGVAVYGKGVEGFYVDPNKTLVIRFPTEVPGKYSFRCDLHSDMKGELYLMEIPTA